MGQFGFVGERIVQPIMPACKRDRASAVVPLLRLSAEISVCRAMETQALRTNENQSIAFAPPVGHLFQH
jgi:hypothetical protein